jgi:glycine/D-amino acid oxidase-like deaminating enzyme
MAHGEADWYTTNARDARRLWLELQEETGTRIWEPVGAAWFVQARERYTADSRPTLERAGIRHEWLAPEAARDLYPSVRVDDLAGVLFEPDAGVLHARRATQLLVEDAERRGADLETGHMSPEAPPGADVVVWACGAWLPSLFPGELELTVSRQEVFFFGGDARWRNTPGFIDPGGGFYGHGDVAGLGVKIASRSPGEAVDPDTVDRVLSPDWQTGAREYLVRRFPDLADAPVVGGRVCQYVLTADTHFVVARHPKEPAWWLVGGGSGHGFKHGPAFGEYVADCIEGACEPEPFHGLGPRSASS